MDGRTRTRLPIAPFGALFCVAAMSWLGLYGYAWNDYENEALPAMQALVHGHFERFAQLAPSYGGSLLLRAPFALLPGLWGGGSLAVYQAISVPCLLAAALLAAWLCARMRAVGHGLLARGLAVGLCVANPNTLRALELGHADELLGGSLCVAAVLLIATGSRTTRRALLAGVLIGLAIANKEWALLALGPALLMLGGWRARLSFLGAALTSAAALLAPIALLSPSFVSATKSVASTPSSIFQPWQAFWFLGRHGALVHGLFGNPKPGYRIAPAWIGPISHPLILLCGALVPLLFVAVRGLRTPEVGAVRGLLRPIGLPDALLMLTLLMLLRCLLDTWDNVYYTVPFLISLLTWEVSVFRRPPVIALCVTALDWTTFHWMPEHVSPDAQAAFFLAWTAPLAILLLVRLYAPTLRLALPIRAAASETLADRQPA